MAELIDRKAATDSNPVRVWTRAFRGTLCSDEPMCPCAVLGAVSRDLPPEVAAEVQRFFKMCLGKMVAEGLSKEGANELLATIMGAMIVANALGSVSAYDRATRDLPRVPAR